MWLSQQQDINQQWISLEEVSNRQKGRGSFFNANDDGGLSKAIINRVIKLDQLDDLLNGDLIFKGARWKVTFGDSFKKSLERIEVHIRRIVVDLMMMLSNGWRYPQKRKNPWGWGIETIQDPWGSHYPPDPPIRTSRVNYSPCESSMVYSKYASPMEAMGRNITPMPSLLGQAYGNHLNNILNGWYYPLYGSNYGSNPVNHVWNNSNYPSNCFNYVPRGLDINPLGFAQSGDNYVSHGSHNIMLNSTVDTYIDMPTNLPTFWLSGNSDCPKKFSDGWNYVSSDPIFPSNGSNMMLNVPPVLPDLESDPHPMPNNVSNDAICASGGLNAMFDGL
ncbi:hypothetical protein GIB67_038191 [Kingdonia uniflora]|uniref:Uncharacterized protein n=1 Tax=Kingdonia uniflora TaxID=39325 RepID=A0A7J7NHG5_9MAGN|nr:hypothetical protein GIB67_038191 [Kingdonia uniflora]